MNAKLILGIVGGFMIGNAVWDILHLNPVLSVLIGAGILGLALK